MWLGLQGPWALTRCQPGRGSSRSPVRAARAGPPSLGSWGHPAAASPLPGAPTRHPRLAGAGRTAPPPSPSPGLGQPPGSLTRPRENRPGRHRSLSPPSKVSLSPAKTWGRLRPRLCCCRFGFCSDIVSRPSLSQPLGAASSGNDAEARVLGRVPAAAGGRHFLQPCRSRGDPNDRVLRRAASAASCGRNPEGGGADGAMPTPKHVERESSVPAWTVAAVEPDMVE